MDSDKGYFTMDRYNGFTTKLQPIETAPRDGTFIILFGPSGYVGTPLRCEVCSYKPKYRPLQPWVDYSGESFEDSGEPAIYWIPIPICEDNLPEKIEMKICTLIDRQKIFSEKAFGPGKFLDRIVDHIKQELTEVETSEGDLVEWVDVILLSIDGAWRGGYNSGEIEEMLFRKLKINEQREWPDPKTCDPNRAINHIEKSDDENITLQDNPPIIQCELCGALNHGNITCPECRSSWSWWDEGKENNYKGIMIIAPYGAPEDSPYRVLIEAKNKEIAVNSSFRELKDIENKESEDISDFHVPQQNIGATHWFIQPNGLFTYYKLEKSRLHLWIASTKQWVIPMSVPSPLYCFADYTENG